MVSCVKRHLVHHYHQYQHNKRAHNAYQTIIHIHLCIKILFKVFMRLKMFWNWKNSFITSCTKEKIFNQWNDNIIHSLKRPIIYNLLCIYFVLVAASWSCKMSFDEGMARDTFVIKRFDVTEVVNGLNKNTTKEQKSNIFFHLYV